MAISRNVIVVGGGFSGATVAAALGAIGVRVTVVEQHRGVDPRFRGELIHPHGTRALARLGLLAPLRDAGAVPVAGFVVHDEEGAPAVLPYGLDSGLGLGIEHPLLVRTLREVVQRSHGVRWLSERRVTGLLRERGRVVGVTDASGEELRGDLVIVADGYNSRLRGLVGLEAQVDLVSYMVVLSIDADVLPRPGFGHVFLGAPGPVLAYPHARGRARVCIDVPRDAPRGLCALGELVRRAYAPALPEPLRGAAVAAAAALQVCANHRTRVPRCTAPGAVLVGDAAGCSHPLTATGMTCALADVDALGAAVASGALGGYERARSAFVRPREVLSDALYEVLRGGDDGALAMRRGIMRYWRTSARARARSIGILSGEISDARAFVAEYSRVTGLAALDVWAGFVRAPALEDRARRTGKLLRTALRRIARTVSDLRGAQPS